MAEIYKGNITDKMWITPRSYETVANSLGLNIEKLKPGTKILSVGEGRSDFASSINKKFGDKEVVAIALDPVYSVADAKLPKREFVKKLKTSGLKKVGVGLPAHLSPVPTARLRESEKNRVDVAGTVYQLPFANESFDQVVLPSVFEYLDLNQAMPELLRVLKKDGEIRINRTQLSILLEDDEDLDEMFEHDDELLEAEAKEAGLKIYLHGLVEEDKGYLKTLQRHSKSPHIERAVEQIAKENIRMYVFVTEYSIFDSSPSYVSPADGGMGLVASNEKTILGSNLIIIKKGFDIPEVSNMAVAENCHGPKELGKLIKIDTSKIYSDYRGNFCYGDIM